MNSIITKRFLACADQLISEEKVNSKRQFAHALDYLPQGLSEMYHGRRDVTIELLRKAAERFHFNPHYLLLGEGAKFLEEGKEDLLQVLTVVTDNAGDERIVHVPVPAQAGYASGQYADPVFIQNLPTYRLPGFQLNAGTYRSFDVSGESMEPVLRRGDKIVCAYVEKQYWEQAIKDQQIYTIVSQDDIVVKRCINKIRKHRIIECQSDNPEFQPYIIPVDEIREIWKVRLKVSAYLESDPKKPDLDQKIATLKEHLEVQSGKIDMITEAMRQLISNKDPKQ